MPKDLTGTVEPIWKTAVDDTNLCLDWKYGEEALLLDVLFSFFLFFLFFFLFLYL